MQKGETVYVKGQPATYIGKTSQLSDEKSKHLLKLASGEHKELKRNEFVTTAQVEERSKENAARKQTEKETKKNSPEYINGKVNELKYKIRELEKIKQQIFREQESEVGGLDGGTDEFESTGRHNVYGSRLNAVDKKISTLNRKINELKGVDSNENMTYDEVMALQKKTFGEGQVKEAINLLESLTNKKVELKP
jgi:hypothetical protein